MTKVCKICDAIKKISDFYVDSKAKDGHWSNCKTCSDKKTLEYKRTIPGLIVKIYTAQKHSSKKRNLDPPKYSKEELWLWIIKHKDFKRLYNNWVESKYNSTLIPSVDRLDDYKGYSFDNIRLVTWQENLDKSYSDLHNGKNNKKLKKVTQYSLDGSFICDYKSITFASSETKTNLGHISNCCRGSRPTAGGFIWKFKEMQ